MKIEHARNVLMRNDLRFFDFLIRCARVLQCVTRRNEIEKSQNRIDDERFFNNMTTQRDESIHARA